MASRTLFAKNWELIPDFVVGRVGYDNWLVDNAYHQGNTSLVDTTKTIALVHQTSTTGGSGESKERKNIDRFYNFRLAQKDS